MSSQLFAFNVSKKVEENTLPTFGVAYDPNEQVNVWMGTDDIKAAWYCSTLVGQRCNISGVNCTNSGGQVNKKCDVF